MSLAQTRLNKIRQAIRDRIDTNRVIISSGGDDGERLAETNLVLLSVLQLFDKPEEFPTFDDWMFSPWDGDKFVWEVIKLPEIPWAQAAFEAGRK